MSDYIYFFPDVNDEIDARQERENFWSREPGPDYVPSEFVRLVCRGVEPELAADLVADDGLPVAEPIDIADDGEPVVIWLETFEGVS
jgi:hypothetical protein